MGIQFFGEDINFNAPRRFALSTLEDNDTNTSSPAKFDTGNTVK